MTRTITLSDENYRALIVALEQAEKDADFVEEESRGPGAESIDGIEAKRLYNLIIEVSTVQE